MTKIELQYYEIIIREIPKIRKALESLTTNQNRCEDTIERALTDVFDKMKEDEECNECGGRGETNWTCCGDDIVDEDIKMCPTCKEHCGDNEPCESCQ